ncbi:hypothetical protein [Actinoplanes flavus]|uniref:Uncharacterized protein n=1 Tax=Actinoplanes flavus TaxID=2820290 RepID=A0ABS3V049_9ACTN|nr:hypothetical protein [Actinoplanes flavus]MBO3744164.1 hypothetical protein [Actinoplanes flavus]
MSSSFPWPRIVAVLAGLSMLGGWLWDSLLLWALAAVLGTVALVLNNRVKSPRR